MTAPKFVVRSLALLAICFAVALTAKAQTSTTINGTFSTDNQIFTYTFSNTSAQDFTFFTTSYGGGMNSNGSFTSAGGFVPVLTLFSSSSGNALAFGGGDGMCHGTANADPTTGLCEDAYLTLLLGAGSYTLDLTEFPNVALGGLNDGFLAGSDPNFTGTTCNGSSSQFLQVDVAPCVQRNDNFSLNVSTSPVPEPSTWLFMLPWVAGITLFGRRQLAKF